MTGLLVLLLILVVLFLLAILKISLQVLYDEDFRVNVRCLCFHFSVFGEEKKPKPPKPKKQPEKPASSKPAPPKQKGIPPVIKQFLPYWRELLSLVGQVLRAPSLDLLKLQIAAGGKDPEACAMTYGRICAGLSAVLPALQQIFELKKQEIDVQCCFERPETEVRAEIRLSLRIYEILALAVSTLRLLLQIRREPKP